MKFIIPAMILIWTLMGQIPENYSLERFDPNIIPDGITTAGLNSNSIRHIRFGDDPDLLFIATSGGLGYAGSNGGSVTLRSFDADSVIMPQGGNPGLRVSGIDIAVSGVVQVDTPDGLQPAGTGISYSSDGGLSWNFKPQPVDLQSETIFSTFEWGGQEITRLDVTTEINNVSYDLAILGDYIYAASWAGGLQRFRFKNIPPGEEGEDTNPWQPIPLPMDSDLDQYCGFIDTDNYTLNPRDPIDNGSHNHKGFSVYALEDTLWVGTAGGINKGVVLDNGCINWLHHFTAIRDGFSGNWVIGFDHQQLISEAGEDFIRLWAITWSTGGDEYYSLSYTDNGGSVWNTVPQFDEMGQKIYGLYADSDRVLAATDAGLYLSMDGLHWERLSHPAEITGENLFSDSFFACGYQAGDQRIWTGTSDGLAYTDNQGSTWEVIRFWSPVNEPDHSNDHFYAYPNPFYSRSANSYNGENFARLVFHKDDDESARLSVFDFSMAKVIDLENAVPVGNDYEFQWNCRNDWGEKVANGVYFCRLKTGSETYWTKLMIINN